MAGQDPQRTSASMFAAEVEALADKLEWWAESLPERERELLTQLLTRAVGPGRDEVHGYDARIKGRPISHLVRILLAGDGGNGSASSAAGVSM